MHGEPTIVSIADSAASSAYLMVSFDRSIVSSLWSALVAGIVISVWFLIDSSSGCGLILGSVRDVSVFLLCVCVCVSVCRLFGILLLLPAS